MVKFFKPRPEAPPKPMRPQISRKSIQEPNPGFLRRMLMIDSKHLRSPNIKYVVLDGRPLIIQYDMIISSLNLDLDLEGCSGYELIDSTERLKNMECEIKVHIIDGQTAIYHVPNIQRREFVHRPRIYGLRNIVNRISEEQKEEILEKFDTFQCSLRGRPLEADSHPCDCQHIECDPNDIPRVTYTFQNRNFKTLEHAILYSMNYSQTRKVDKKHFEELLLQKKIQGIDEDTLKIVKYIYFSSFSSFPNLFLMKNHWYTYTPTIISEEAENSLIQSIFSVEARIGLVKLVMISRILGTDFWNRIYKFCCDHLHMCPHDFVCNMVREFSIEEIQKEKTMDIEIFLMTNFTEKFNYKEFMLSAIGKAFVKSMENARYYPLLSADCVSLMYFFESKAHSPLKKNAPKFEQYNDAQPPSDVELESDGEMEEE